MPLLRFIPRFFSFFLVHCRFTPSYYLTLYTPAPDNYLKHDLTFFLGNPNITLYKCVTFPLYFNSPPALRFFIFEFHRTKDYSLINLHSTDKIYILVRLPSASKEKKSEVTAGKIKSLKQENGKAMCRFLVLS